jgi:hypothetical protein
LEKFIVKNISHLDEFTTHFDHFNLKEVHEIQGFDPNNLFSTHMFAIGYGSSFNKSIQLEEGGGDNQNPPEVSPEKTLDDIDTLVSTNDHYKKWGRNTIGRNLDHQMFLKKCFNKRKTS